MYMFSIDVGAILEGYLASTIQYPPTWLPPPEVPRILGNSKGLANKRQDWQ